MPDNQSTTTAPGGSHGFTVENDQVVPAQPPVKEPSFEENQAQLNSPPENPGDYTLPEFRTESGEPWHPDERQTTTIDTLRRMARTADLRVFEFGHIADKWGKPGDVSLAPEVSEARLRAAWGMQYEARTKVAEAQLQKVEARFPGTIRYLEQTGRRHDVDLLEALWRAGSYQQRKR